MKWTVKTVSGHCFAEVGDTFSANGAGGEPHIDATCKDPANTVLWESAEVQEAGSGYNGKMANGYMFVITSDANGVYCELQDTTPGRPDGSSGTWSGDDD